MNDYSTFVIAVIGAVTGVVGTVIGLYSVWLETSRDRVKLRVSASNAILTHAPGPYITVTVLNMSAFPVVIHEAGFFNSKGHRIINVNTPTIRNGPFPVRLEPRCSLTALFSPEILLEAEKSEFLSAYASTECGVTARSSHGAFRGIIDEMRKGVRAYIGS